MSMVAIQLGQCGNQIGEQLFSTLANNLQPVTQTGEWSTRQEEDYVEAVSERFFHTTANSSLLEARSVMVDMEEKVIAQSLASARRSGIWRYPDGQQLCQKRGSGNNWALGYHGHGPQVEEKVLELVRRETEKCDRLAGFLPLLSLAGGTGSGLGTYVTRSLRTHYPHAAILNTVVAPYRMGEVIVQNYNAVLTLSHIYNTADALLCLDNDALHTVCARRLNLKHVSFTELNRVICHHLASVLLPVYSARRPKLNHNHLGDLLECLVSQPEHRLLTALSVPLMADAAKAYSTYSWAGQTKQLRQMLLTGASMEEGVDWSVTSGAPTSLRSVACLLVQRGADLAAIDPTPLRDPRLYSSWLPPSHALTHWVHPRPLAGYERGSALLANSQAGVCGLRRSLRHAWKMFCARAFLHQYARYGLEEDSFMDSFAALEQIVASYDQLGGG